jgi:hypothetical protein
MAQIQSKYTEVRIPFTKMSYTPDIPSTSLSPNEYNFGLNVETDARGIRSMAGDEEILNTIPGTPTFVTAGFRLNGEYWFLVAVTEGKWYATNGTSVPWYDVTPGGTTFAGYSQNTNITDAWNGSLVFVNDTFNPPMFLPDTVGATLIMYSNLQPVNITNITYVDPTTQQITFSPAYAATPYVAGDQIVISGVNTYYNGTFTVVSSTTTTINYTATPASAYPGTNSGQFVAPLYSWNYNPDWLSVSANFMRMYNTPNVGSILVAGNLTVVPVSDPSTTENYPVTVQWSQAFGLNQAPLTWIPTVTNVANQLEVPLRGPALDAFPCNGQFFLSSYWDTVVFSPINYSTTQAPILGVRLFNQGRGLLSSNCWASTDKNIYGVDARDIWVFNGNDFQGIGNQRVKNWFYDQLDELNYDRVFMQVNTQRNQIEIYYPDSTAFNGVPNRMLSYRYDLDCWNAPREVENGATYAVESPIYISNIPNLGSRTVVYAQGTVNSKLIQKDQGFSWSDNSPIESVFRRDNIKLLKDYSGKLMVHRILPELNNMGAEAFADDDELPIDPATSTNKGNVTVTIQGATSVGSPPTSTTAVTKPVDTDSPWYQIDQNAFRVNTIELSNTSNNSVWMCSATTWQYTQVEDDR